MTTDTVAFPRSIWADTAQRRQLSLPLAGEARADLVVIGAGFTGLSAAIEAARQGLSVIVLEGMAVGWGASGRNNGQVIPTMTAAEPDAIAAKWGAAGQRFARLVGESADILFSLVREERLEKIAEAEQTGWFQPAHSPGRVKLSRSRVEAWERWGFPAQFLDAEETRALLGTGFWHGGMLNPTGGHVNPLGLARGMAAAAERHGVTIHERSPALSYAREGTGWRVETEAGTVRARSLILATNAYTGELASSLAPRIAREIVPVLSWQMSTAPVSDTIRATLLPGRQAVSDTRGDLRFFRYDARNRLITGGVVMGSRDVANRVRAKAAKNLAEAFPQLGTPEMTHVWSGYIGMTADRFPRVHRLGRDGYAWTGDNGRGVALGVALGRDLARAAAGTPVDQLALPFTEPTPLPAHAIARRIAPYYLAWMRRKDRVEPR
ncbi:FAD-dependent oxidoreductase [Paracoccus sp. S-4012]|uniref:NAD(P)/FAD-dependent oxidoreductase n=1 Tax=Paracoccus sp. S-4012 TaxID=2665648 RepID=UPI0012B0188C|nr:FAD-dependent oxidoreductase [Paracoccus sp. S-4012]MRX50460.1 FAD-dependent oxidoreductase [Paracoccus sp. S-4012]